MLFGPGHIVTAILVYLAYLWTREVYERFEKDCEELANSREPLAKAVIIIYWLITVVIVLVVGLRVWQSCRDILDFLRK